MMSPVVQDLHAQLVLALAKRAELDVMIAKLYAMMEGAKAVETAQAIADEPEPPRS